MSKVLIKYEDVMIEDQAQSSINLKVFTLLITHN